MSAVDVSATDDWRHESCRLAFEKGMDGQASRLPDQQGIHVYLVVTVTELVDHWVLYDPDAQTVMCDCFSGKYQRPCAHAGAALLLMTRLVAPRARDPHGRPKKGYNH